MSDKSGWKERIALSVRVGAMVAVLGFVVLAAEHRLAQDISPLEILTAEVLPGFEVATSPEAQAEAPPAQTAAAPDNDDFTAAPAAPASEREEQPATF
jgi:HAMP domain-containing protein